MTNNVNLETLALLASEVTLPMGLVLDEVEIQVGKADATIKPFAIQLEKPADLTVRLSAGNIAAFLEKEAPGGLKDFRVTVGGGLLNVEATGRLIVEIRVTAVCKLRVVDRSKLFVDLQSVSVPMAYNIVEQQLAKINPILDLNDVAPSVKIDTVSADEGVVTVKGVADMPPFPME